MNYQALSIFGAAKCTLECNYCYIKKTDGIREMDKQVVSWLENPVIPKIIKTKYVTSLTLWGGEPTLHLDKICKNIEKYKKLFPNLTEFHTSSNMSYSKHYDVFAKMLADNNYKLDLQISDDSILFNKENRGISSKVIQSNTLKFIKALNDAKCDFSYHFKATTNIDNFKLLSENDEALHTYFNYFDDFAGMIKNIVGDSNFQKMQTSASVVCPGAYSKQDGIILYNYLLKMINWLKEDKFNNCKHTTISLNYPDRWQDKIYRMKDYTNAQHTFTCSAGDSNIQVDTLGGVHLCHRPLFFAYDNHINELKTLDSNSNDDVEYLANGIIDVYKLYYSQDHEKIKLHLRSLHDNYTHRISTTTAIIMELAHCSQIDEIYKDKKRAEVFALYLNSCCGCPVENFFVTSSWHLCPISIIRLFGNGAFTLINSLVKRQ